MSIKLLIKKVFPGLVNFINGIYLWMIPNIFIFNRKKWGKCGKDVRIGAPLIITNKKNIYIEGKCGIGAGGKFITHTGKIIIKNYTVLAYNVTIVTGNHTPTVGIPQYELGRSHINDKETDIIIHEDVWVGTNVTILSGAELGRGCIIGACSLVNKPIPPYAVVAGVPSRIIGVKFSLNQIIKHEQTLYNENERTNIDYLESLFETIYKNCKVLGTSNINYNSTNL